MATLAGRKRTKELSSDAVVDKTQDLLEMAGLQSTDSSKKTSTSWDAKQVDQVVNSLCRKWRSFSKLDTDYSYKMSPHDQLQKLKKEIALVVNEQAILYQKQGLDKKNILVLSQSYLDAIIAQLKNKQVPVNTMTLNSDK